MTVFYRPVARAGPSAETGMAGDQPGAIPILDGAPSYSDLPVDETNQAVGLLYHDINDDTTKVAMPDGSGGVATGSLLDLSASVTLGSDDLTGLL